MERLRADSSFLNPGGRDDNGRVIPPVPFGSGIERDRHYKVYKDGTHRARTPEETLAQVQKLFPVFGITRLANVTGLDVIGIPVVMAVRPNARSLSVSQGKGLTLAAAKVSRLRDIFNLT